MIYIYIFLEFQLVALLGTILGSGLLIRILSGEGVSIILTICTISGLSTSLFQQTLAIWSKSMMAVYTAYLFCLDGHPQMALSSCFAGPMLGTFTLFGKLEPFNINYVIYFEYISGTFISFVYSKINQLFDLKEMRVLDHLDVSVIRSRT